MVERELKRILLKEEFVALTGDYIKAIMLAQLEYWQKRAKEFDKFVDEEKERLTKEGVEINMTPSHGWIYKSAQELSSETMLGFSKSSIRSHLKELINMGYVLERQNPYHKWDRTMQYRLDLIKIKKDLNSLGYELQDWIMDVTPHNHTSSKIEHRESKNRTSKNFENPDENKNKVGSVVTPYNHTSSKIEHRESRNRTSKFENKTAIPEIITETINRNYILPLYNPPLLEKSITQVSNKLNFQKETKRVHTEKNILEKTTSKDLRKAIFREGIFEVFDNLNGIKTDQELVEEGVTRACKDILINRNTKISSKQIKIMPEEIAEEIKKEFPYGLSPRLATKKRKFFVAKICDLTSQKLAQMFSTNNDTHKHL